MLTSLEGKNALRVRIEDFPHPHLLHCLSIAGCGLVCEGQCVAGMCKPLQLTDPSCLHGNVRCGTGCVDLATDSLNCGACANQCAYPTIYCAGGVCR